MWVPGANEVALQFFSTKERLQLAHHGQSSPCPTSTNPQRPASRRNSSTKKRTKSLLDPFELPVQNNSRTPRRKSLLRRLSSAKQTPVTSDTAALFASLPAAIRRKQFSREEQVLLASERHPVILDAADNLYNKHCRQTSFIERPLTSLSRPATSYFPITRTQSSFLLDPDREDEEDGIRDDTMIEFDPASYKWLEEEPHLDLRIDDYHASIAETARRQSELPARRPFARNLSISNLSLRRSSISSQRPPQILTRSAHPSMYFSQAPTMPASPTAHRPRASTRQSSISSVDPNAQHYQDPAARMKLRVYLASPSKFDEALEFGFPSAQDKSQEASGRPKTSPRLTDGSGRSLYTDDTPSLSGDDGSSHVERETLYDPRTPDDAHFRQNRTSQKSSNDRHSIRPHVLRGATEPYAQGTTLDREMTIHMTLTRPDLRSPQDSQFSTKTINAQPIEQSTLPSTNGPTSIWETMPEDQSKMKKLWKKLTLR